MVCPLLTSTCMSWLSRVTSTTTYLLWVDVMWMGLTPSQRSSILQPLKRYTQRSPWAPTLSRLRARSPLQLLVHTMASAAPQ